MTPLLERLLELIAIKLITMLLSRQTRQGYVVPDSAIDARLATVRNAYKQAFDGTPITRDQRERLNSALSDFVRGTGSVRDDKKTE